MQLKNLIRNIVLTLVVSILVFLYIRSKDVKVGYFITDKNNEKKKISFDEYNNIQYLPSEKKDIYFLSKEPVHLYKKALIYSGSFFGISMLVLTIMHFRKRKE